MASSFVPVNPGIQLDSQHSSMIHTASNHSQYREPGATILLTSTNIRSKFMLEWLRMKIVNEAAHRDCGRSFRRKLHEMASVGYSQAYVRK